MNMDTVFPFAVEGTVRGEVVNFSGTAYFQMKGETYLSIAQRPTLDGNRLSDAPSRQWLY